MLHEVMSSVRKSLHRTRASIGKWGPQCVNISNRQLHMQRSICSVKAGQKERAALSDTVRNLQENASALAARCNNLEAELRVRRPPGCSSCDWVHPWHRFSGSGGRLLFGTVVETAGAQVSFAILALQDKQAWFEAQLSREHAALEGRSREIERDLAVQASLASGWERDVKELTAKLDALTAAHQAAQESSASLQQQSAYEQGAKAAAHAQQELAVSRLAAELDAERSRAAAAAESKAAENARLRVRSACPVCTKHTL